MAANNETYSSDNVDTQETTHAHAFVQTEDCGAEEDLVIHEAVLQAREHRMPPIVFRARVLRRRPTAEHARKNSRQLSVQKVLAWAEAYHNRTGKWPRVNSGAIPESPGESWRTIQRALSNGKRGFKGRSSLPRFLAEHRGIHYHNRPYVLSNEIILSWADEHLARKGIWPTAESGRIQHACGLTWSHVNSALKRGRGSLTGGSSLAKLLAAERGRRNKQALPEYRIEEVLLWAKCHFARTGEWPEHGSGEIPEAPGETWSAVSAALTHGDRGLRNCGYTTLAGLLMQRAGRPCYRYRDPAKGPPVTAAPWKQLYPEWTAEQILALADAFHAKNGYWPNQNSGAIDGAADSTWNSVNKALRDGYRGMPGGSSLSRFLADYRNARPRPKRPALDCDTVLAWADKHYARTQMWPNMYSGPISAAPGETWHKVDQALRYGRGGLPGGGSLAGLLATCRPARKWTTKPLLDLGQVTAWIDAHFVRKKCWPTYRSGPVTESPQYTWALINNALSTGTCGLPGGRTLARLLAETRGIRSHCNLPRFTIATILRWADEWHARTGKWPSQSSGRVSDTSEENWCRIDAALLNGLRGLRGGSSLARLLHEKRGVVPRNMWQPLSIEQILTWADAHYARTQRWPTQCSGRVEECTSETWGAINVALSNGHRGLPGGTTLARLLEESRGKRNHLNRPRLSVGMILDWADSHFARTGFWPKHNTGSIVESPADTWNGIDQALTFGRRGLESRTSLARLLADKRGVPHWKSTRSSSTELT